ncbi:uncharacterized protein N0V89_001762 [Didymosphaeria variabile]|uniref:Uncharacterized protein n=1 Tax=Didymosphaeria variabile TaxID=1932322 RepID=A0A9W9CDQ6_9PLEO|nr:uncharacterized protein N0V89_001762 [Didymosphaeria variabile]KAJ4357187.1 hypothetical protein N0V89_001762 [Didymosphaeria variabile]
MQTRPSAKAAMPPMIPPAIAPVLISEGACVELEGEGEDEAVADDDTDEDESVVLVAVVVDNAVLDLEELMEFALRASPSFKMYPS